MNWNLSIAYPWWYILLCLLCGAVYAGVLYYKSKDAALFGERWWIGVLLPVLRFLLVSFLAFLLLSPVLKYAGFTTQKPIVVFAVDDSKSMSVDTSYSNQVKQLLPPVVQSLKSKYNIEVVSFDNVSEFIDVSEVSFEGTESNISSALRFINDQYENQNIGGVVLLSDGIYNAGSDPRYMAENSKVPIYTVGVGDTTIYSDLLVQNVSHNSIAYLGNEFPFRVEIKASKLKGKAANMQVSLNGKTIKQKQIVIGSDDFFEEVDVLATSSKVGRNRVDIRLSSFTEEENKSNNNFTFYVDVIDGKKKVAIWAEAPHPDLGMLKAIVSGNENYDVEIAIGAFTAHDKLDLVILHNWFASKAQLNLYEKLRSLGVSVLVVSGNDFNGALFNKGSQDVKYRTRGRGANAVLPLVNGNFEYFELDEDVKKSIKKWPPLKAPFGKFSGYQPSDVLLYQQIGSVVTKEPLVLLGNSNNNKLGIIAGTGVWQWRLAEFETNESHDNVEDLVNKMVQYLAVKQKKKLLKVYPSAKQYGEGESVTLLGELYNQSLDAVTGQEINVSLKDGGGKVYKHTMSASGSQYRLVLDGLSSGAYRYSAAASVGGAKLTDNGYFTVLDQQRELANLTADFDLMRSVAKSTGGEFVPLGDIAQLEASLLQNENLKSVISEENKLNDLINFKWVFWLLFSLLALEWFVRKWAGGY